MRTLTILLTLLPILTFAGNAKIVSGPFQGHTTSSTTKIWFLGADVQEVKCIITNVADSTDYQITNIKASNDYCFKNECPFKADLSKLREASTYTIDLYSQKTLLSSGKITTIRNYEVDDFSFLVGSCAFIGTGKDKLVKLTNSTRIFNTLAEEKEGDFMLWMGDNLYLLGGELKSKKKTLKRYTSVRKHKKLNHFMKKKFHYSTWDDHDFGPNNSDGNFEMKNLTKKVFENYWQNPNEPHPDGVYYKFNYADIEIFMLDDRFNRNDEGSDSIMLGETQLKWLKDGLKASTAAFKIIVSGNQVLNKFDDHECFYQYESERKDLFSFIKESQINGVLFFSGDRHHSEILKRQEKGTYPFYDFTVSGLTSWRHPLRGLGKEGKNEFRIGDFIVKHNYAVISISGIQHERSFKITYKDKFGKILQEHTLKQQEVSF